MPFPMDDHKYYCLKMSSDEMVYTHSAYQKDWCFQPEIFAVVLTTSGTKRAEIKAMCEEAINKSDRDYGINLFYFFNEYFAVYVILF